MAALEAVTGTSVAEAQRERAAAASAAGHAAEAQEDAAAARRLLEASNKARAQDASVHLGQMAEAVLAVRQAQEAEAAAKAALDRTAAALEARKAATVDGEAAPALLQSPFSPSQSCLPHWTYVLTGQTTSSAGRMFVKRTSHTIQMAGGFHEYVRYQGRSSDE